MSVLTGISHWPGTDNGSEDSSVMEQSTSLSLLSKLTEFRELLSAAYGDRALREPGEDPMGSIGPHVVFCLPLSSPHSKKNRKAH